MKKWLLVAGIIVLFLVGLDFFLPASGSYRQDVSFASNARAVSRQMIEQGDVKWWPGLAKNDTLTYDEILFLLKEKRFSGLIMPVHYKGLHAETFLNVLPLSHDSVQLSWLVKGEKENFFQRLRHAPARLQLHQSMKEMLEKIAAHFSATENLYKWNIKNDVVHDSTLVSTTGRYASYPTIDEVYILVANLQQYASRSDAKVTGAPMLNRIEKNTDGYYIAQVAIPVSKVLPDSGNIRYKWMLPYGNILSADVKGGPATIEAAFEEMKTYMEENNRTAPAMPFQSLVTNRQTEPDTSKWITKIYWPVM
ncbi:MAG: hypothetical protein ACO1OO_08740 [Flavisolibacter sp.]